VAELEKMHPGARDRLLRWWEAAIVELIPPITPPARPHLVVIEPHMDDAALSAGGRLLHRRGRWRMTILSVVKWSNFTSYLLAKRKLLDVGDLTELRQQESILAAKLLGAEHRCLDWTDAPLRLWPAEHWSNKMVEKFCRSPQAFTCLFPNPREMSLLAGRLMQDLQMLAPDELWIPMGLGDHIDHRTTRNACVMMLAEVRARFSNIPVVMYEDLPYAAYVDHAAQIRAVFGDSGTRLIRAAEDITDVFGEKLRVISVYASQFKGSYMEPGIRKCAARDSDGRFAEVYHRVEGEPHLPPESRLARNLAALEREVRALTVKRATCSRVTVIALPSGHLGRWKTDRESLVTAFPNADLRVYLPENLAWQAEGGGNGQLRLEIVKGRGWRGWIGPIRRALFSLPNPTVVLWSGAYTSGRLPKIKKLINLLITSLLPFRQVLFARTLCDFCGVLSEQIERRE